MPQHFHLCKILNPNPLMAQIEENAYDCLYSTHYHLFTSYQLIMLEFHLTAGTDWKKQCTNRPPPPKKK